MTDQGTTRERILRSAASQFRQKGFNGTSMRELGEAVGITKSSLYHHFPSKQALLAEILGTTVDRTTPGLRAVAESDAPATERLRRAVANHVIEAIRDQDNVACFVEEGRFLSPNYMRPYIAKRDRYEGYLRQILEDGIRGGEFRPVSVRLTSLALLGMANWVVRWFRKDGEFVAEEIAETFAGLAVHGLSAEGPSGDGSRGAGSPAKRGGRART